MFPIGTSIRPKRTPYANYLLIAINVFIFLLSYAPHFVLHPEYGKILEPLRPWASLFKLIPEQPHTWQFLTYAFLHGSWWHILGNMFFLYLFGNNVNDKLGNIGYVVFYLAGAVFSGVGHALISSSPVLGASGAVAAITGAYLVLFPNTTITVIIWFFYDVDIRALWFIGLKLIIFDNMITADASHGIAYGAHLAGYAFGILASLGLLAIGLLGSDFNDLWSMTRQWNRRRRFRDAVADGYDPYKGRAGRKQVNASITDTDPEQDAVVSLRSQISIAMNGRDASKAAALYLDLMNKDDGQVMSEQLQLDIANQLMSEGKWAESAQAYQAFLGRYGNYQYAQQVHLMLGILYSRYLNRPEDALSHLKTALDRLTDSGQKKMCRQEIEKLSNA
jgi:membrane associated rhomboid family serine protease